MDPLQSLEEMLDLRETYLQTCLDRGDLYKISFDSFSQMRQALQEELVSNSLLKRIN